MKIIILLSTLIFTFSLFAQDNNCAFSEEDLTANKNECSEAKNNFKSNKQDTTLKELHKQCKAETRMIKAAIKQCAKVKKIADQLADAQLKDNHKKFQKKCKKLVNQVLKSLVVYEKHQSKIDGDSRKERLKRVQAAKESIEKNRENFEQNCKLNF